MKIDIYKFLTLILCLFTLFLKNTYGNTNASSSRDYGSRINLAPNTPVTADFIDMDGDGIDDRYQKRPREIPNTIVVPGLPKIDSINIDYPLGIPELREGISIYQQYALLAQGKPSQLIPTSPVIKDSKQIQAIIFDFPDSMQIIKFPEEGKYAVGNRGSKAYEYYKLLRKIQ